MVYIQRSKTLMSVERILAAWNEFDRRVIDNSVERWRYRRLR